MSASDPAPWTSADCFRRLRPGVQDWITAQGWREIRPLQVAASQHILTTDQHLLLSAGVASGKTEAAFLPILSQLPNLPADGFEVLYIAPLVALINDQAGRLQRLAASIGRDVTAWHGDIAQSVKANARKLPRGVLLITPESLDSYLAGHPTAASAAFSALRYIVIDEVHAFLNAERGMQLLSVLARLEANAGCTPVRVGLSATLADVGVAKAWLHPGAPDRVVHVLDPAPRRPPRIELFAQLDATEVPAERRSRKGAASRPGSQDLVAQALARSVLRGKHLVFANGRKLVEQVTDALTVAVQAQRSRTEVFAHHSSIARSGKQAAEAALRSEDSPDVCLVCTSTLELGIDVPQVASVAQIGPPPAVSSLKQRAGRSGRGDAQGRLHLYCPEPALDSRASLVQRLRPQLVQAIAMVELMQEGWLEPPQTGLPHLSTLVHQVLSLLLQTSGAGPREMWTLLCERGAFRAVDWPLFKRLLSQLKAVGLVRQEEDAPTVRLDVAGAKIATHYSFPVIFETPREWQLVADGKKLGTLPRILPTLPKDLLLFAGRRWQVVAVDTARHVLEVKPSKAGAAPDFGGSVAPVHDAVRQKMRALYLASHMPDFCDEVAARLLADARTAFASVQLGATPLVQDGVDTLLFHWMGDRTGATLRLQLAAHDLRAMDEGVCLRVAGTDRTSLEGTLRVIAQAPCPDPVALAQAVPNKRAEKYDEFLGQELLSIEYVHRMLDVAGALAATLAICAPAH